MRLAVTVWPWILTALVVAPLMTPGYVLSYDMVFVPDLAMRSDFLGFGWSLPRAVPSDAVVALIDEVIPGMLLQKVVLVAALVLAGTGARRLVPRDNGVAQLAAASLYIWNPYVAERLGIGHWPVLLAYAALPWVFDAGRRFAVGERTFPVLVLWLALAALSAAGGVMAAFVALAGVIGSGAAAWRRMGAVVGAVVLLNAPWVVAGVLHGEAAVSDPAAVGAFATSSEGVLPAPLAALGLGGIWNVEVVPMTRLGWAAVVALVLVVAVSAVGFRAWRAGLPRRSRITLVAMGIAGLGIALAGALLPQVMEWFVAHIPGGGLLRDGSRFLALLAPLEVSLYGFGASVLAGVMRERVAGVALALGAVLMPVALMPDLAWGLAGRLQPVDFPDEFDRARAEIVARPGSAEGRLLVLPFSSYRLPSWNGGRRTLDPLGRYMPMNYVSSDVLYVSGNALRGEDRLAERVAAVLGSGGAPEVVSERLQALGISLVVVDKEAESAVDENGLSVDLEDTEGIFDGELLAVVEQPGAATDEQVGPVRTVVLLTAWVLAGVAVAVAAAAALHGRVSLLTKGRGAK